MCTTLGDTMAARGSSSRGNAHGTPSSLTSLLSPNTLSSLPVVTDPIQLTYYRPTEDAASDRRRYNPTKAVAPPHATQRFATRLRTKEFQTTINQREDTRQSLDDLPTAVGFMVPSLVAICARRKIRREIMFALRHDKKHRGKGGGRPRHRNFWSNVKC
ncbi:hypothetical protein [robinz microvirus RP_45]|nr:hypothetical protein [robinz microvirus RP_45]